MSTSNHMSRIPSLNPSGEQKNSWGPALRRWFILGGLLAFGLGGWAMGCATAPPPPPPKIEIRPARPHARAVWVAGHWQWKGKRNGHVWIPGHWKAN